MGRIVEDRDHQSERRRVRKALVALAVAGVLIAAFVGLRSGRRGVAKQAPPSDELPALAAREMAPWMERTYGPPPANDPRPIDVGVVIDEVTVDKQEICRGEEAIVSVRARATDGGKEFLSFGVLGRPELVGPRFPLHLQQSLGYQEMRVFARGKSGAAITATVPPVVVKDCDAPVTAGIDYRRDAAAPDRAWLTARVGGGAAAGEGAFQPVRYLWDFGDGRTEVTTTAEVEHSYEGRLQDAAYAYFFVTVTAQGGDGREARGSRALRFVNLGFAPFDREKRVAILAGVKASGSGGEKVWLYHGGPRALRLDEVVVKDTVLDSNSNETVTATRTHDAASLLGVRELPAGSSREVADLGHLRPSSPDVVRVLEISGHSDDGTLASGSFNLLAPQPALASTSAPERPN